jgi:hypothetical protein
MKSMESQHTLGSDIFLAVGTRALRACIGMQGKTPVVQFLVACMKKHKAERVSWCLSFKPDDNDNWHKICNLLVSIIRHHPEVYDDVVCDMLDCTTGAERADNVSIFHETLAYFLFRGNPQRTLTRKIIKTLILKTGSVPTSIDLCSDPAVVKKAERAVPSYEADSEKVAPCVLTAFVRQLGNDRVKPGSDYDRDYGDYLDAAIEADLRRVLDNAVWSEDSKLKALKTAFHLRFGIVAQVLMRPPYLVKPPSCIANHPWMMAISDFLFQPGNPGAQGLVERLKISASELDAMPQHAHESEPDRKKQRQHA